MKTKTKNKLLKMEEVKQKKADKATISWIDFEAYNAEVKFMEQLEQQMLNRIFNGR